MANIIPFKDGRDLFQNYLRNAQYNIKVGTTVIRAMSISKDMLSAMNSLQASHPNLAGFRVYVGLDANNQKVGVVVGLNADGTDATSLELYAADWGYGSPCPPLCDRNSSMN
jgi:hypothetical protein